MREQLQVTATALMLTMALAAAVVAQQPAPPPLVQQGGGGRGDGAGARAGGAGRGNAPPSLPTPRGPDGRVNFGAPKGETGVWERRNEHLVVNPNSYQAAATRTARINIDQVPLQPWAKALTNERHLSALASEPYTRCKPSGGPRQLMSPYGLEIVDFADLKRIYIFNVSNAQSYRTIYMD